jgi:hypothetical protein
VCPITIEVAAFRKDGNNRRIQVTADGPPNLRIWVEIAGGERFYLIEPQPGVYNRCSNGTYDENQYVTFTVEGASGVCYIPAQTIMSRLGDTNFCEDDDD